MLRCVGLLVVVVACGAAPRPHAAAIPGPSRLRLVGQTNPDSMPPACRAHGGSPPVPSGPMVWAGSSTRDRRLDSLGRGMLVFHVLSARTGAAFPSAVIVLEPATFALAAPLTADGRGNMQAPAGTYELRIAAFPVRAFLDSARFRRGYADTLKLVLGQPWYCGL